MPTRLPSAARYALTVLIGGVLMAPTRLAAAEPAPKLEKLVWCHYTAWHHPTSTDFAISRYYNFPWLRPCGQELADYRHEIELAQSSGIDGFFVDLTGGDKKPTGYIDHLARLLQAAEGTTFLVGPCLDNAHPNLDWQVAELEKLLARCADHPNYPKVDGRPVVNTYSCMGRTPEQWRYIREKLREKGREIFLGADLGQGFKPAKAESAAAYAAEFDLLTSFHESGIRGQTIREVFDLFAHAARTHGHYWMPPVSPGYIGAWLNGRNDFYQPHLGFDQLWDCWQAILPGQADWVHLTTWNDHDETPLMPTSFDFGTAVKLNRAWTDRWRGKPYQTEQPEVCFAYHREEIAGTVWRLEALSLPCQIGQSVELAGELLGPDGAVLAQLPPHALSLRDFDRTEWNVPTAALAAVPAVTPRLTLTVLGDPAAPAEPARYLPAFLPVSGWIQNQVTVRVPWSKLSERRAELKVAQTGARLTAGLKIEAGEPLAHVSLWRNDRPLGEFAAAAAAETDAAELNVWLHPLAACAYQLRVEGGRIEFADRDFTDDGQELTVDETTLRTGRSMPWNTIGLRLRATPETKLFITLDGKGQTEQATTAAELLAGNVLAVGEPKPLLTMELADSDVGLLRRPALDGAPVSAELSLALLSRPARENDLFTARAETVSGRIIFANFAAPFCAGVPARTMNLIQTCVNLETTSGATGMPGGREFLFVPPFRQPRLTQAPVHPAAFRSGRWTFERSAADDLGERPFRQAKSFGWKSGSGLIQPGGRDGGHCLALDGQTKVDFRLRSYPLGACTIDFYLNPAATPEKRQTILTRSGWTSAFSFFLQPDGRLEVIRDGGDLTPKTSLVGDRPLPVGQWTRVTLSFDECVAKLFLDGAPAGEMPVEPRREYGNCTAHLGATENGFAGQIDDLTFLSWPAAPGDAVFAAAKPGP